MFNTASNDRTALRLIGHRPMNTDSPDAALMTWLHQQTRMLEGWQADLVSRNGNPKTAELIEAHHQWLSKALSALNYPDTRKSKAI